MNDYNYDDWADFHGKNEKSSEKQERAARLLREIFDDSDDEEPICRNLDCKFTDCVLEYLALEWSIDLGKYSHEIQTKGMDLIDAMKGKDNPPNVAAKIAQEVVPLL